MGQAQANGKSSPRASGKSNKRLKREVAIQRSKAEPPEQQPWNLHRSPNHRAQDEWSEIRDGRNGRFGFVFLDDVDSDEYRVLGGVARGVYAALLGFVGGSSRAWPSLTTLGRIVGVHRKSNVARAVKELERGGFLVKSGKTPQGGNVYTIMRPFSRRSMPVGLVESDHNIEGAEGYSPMSTGGTHG